MGCVWYSIVCWKIGNVLKDDCSQILVTLLPRNCRPNKSKSGIFWVGVVIDKVAGPFVVFDKTRHHAGHHVIIQPHTLGVAVEITVPVSDFEVVISCSWNRWRGFP